MVAVERELQNIIQSNDKRRLPSPVIVFAFHAGLAVTFKAADF